MSVRHGRILLKCCLDGEPGGDRLPARHGLVGHTLLVFGIGLEDKFPHAVLGRRIDDWSQQRETVTFTVDRVLPCGKRDVPAGAAAALPDREPDQLEAVLQLRKRVSVGSFTAFEEPTHT